MQTLFELALELLFYPVRNNHPIVVATYGMTLLAGVVGLCLLIRHFIPNDPFR